MEMLVQMINVDVIHQEYSNGPLLVLSVSKTQGRGFSLFQQKNVFLSSSCSQNYHCMSYTMNYLFVQCMDGKCTCNHDMGITGEATADNKCRCEGTMVYGTTIKCISN